MSDDQARPVEPGADKAPPPPEELQAWIAELKRDHVSPTALVRVEMAADALRRAYQRPDDYTRCMELVDRHLKAAQEADRSSMKETIRKLKAMRQKGDRQTAAAERLGRKPRLVEG
jgi:hypothetical protein